MKTRIKTNRILSFLVSVLLVVSLFGSVTELGWGLFDGCENVVTVYCDEGSVIQDYCKRNGIREARITAEAND